MPARTSVVPSGTGFPCRRWSRPAKTCSRRPRPRHGVCCLLRCGGRRCRLRPRLLGRVRVYERVRVCGRVVQPGERAMVTLRLGQEGVLSCAGVVLRVASGGQPVEIRRAGATLPPGQVVLVIAKVAAVVLLVARAAVPEMRRSLMAGGNSEIIVQTHAVRRLTC
eukprot:Rmarinus@m.8109